MKKIVRLTENDLTRIVKKVIKEQQALTDDQLDRASSKVMELLNSNDDRVREDGISLLKTLNDQRLNEIIFNNFGVSSADGLLDILNETTLDFSGEQMDMLPDLSMYQSLESIRAIGCGLNTLPPVEHLPKSLEILNLMDNDITEADLEGYSEGLPNLMRLSLDNNPIQWANDEEIARISEYALVTM